LGELAEHVAIVTGGSRGIGKAICLALARRGATVVACARSREKLEALAAEAAEQSPAGKIVPQTLDVTDGQAVRQLVEDVAEQQGRIDILVC